MSSHSKVQYSLGKVPFSWENKPGVSKATQTQTQTQTQTYRDLPPPPCPFEASSKLSLHDFQLPLPPCTFQPLSRSSSSKSLRSHEDPFLVAFQECTKPPKAKAKTSHKYGSRSGFGSWFGFGFSCTRSSSVRDDSLVRVSKLPFHRDRAL